MDKVQNMDKVQWNESGRWKGNIIQVMKKGTACLLALSLALSPAAPVMAAETELQPDTGMIVNGGGLTTAYKWEQRGAGHFDIEGIEDASLIGKDGAYIDSRARAVITTFGFNGYETVIQRKGGEGGRRSITISSNGGVQTIDSLHVEVQMKVYPSPDQKWILVDYIVYNKIGETNSIQIASGTDVQVGGRSGSGASDPADASVLDANERGFHMVNEETQQTFDCIYKNDSLGLTMPTTRWVGQYNARSNYYFVDGPHTVNDGDGTKIDSGLTYSWEINLQPYETALRRVAFAAKGPSYYVSKNGDNGNVGTYDAPLATIEAAIAKIGEHVGYVYIEQDYEMTSDITVPSGAAITFMSSDYSREGDPIEDIITLKRGSGLRDEPMFKTNGGTMRFSNLVLDGNQENVIDNAAPILSADVAGTIGIMSGATLQNNRVVVDDIGSAIQVGGSANLEMNYGAITGNVGKSRGAVNFASNGEFKIQNCIEIKGNKLINEEGEYSEEEANVYLALGKKITVVGDLDGSLIGITTEQQPEATAGGISTRAEQEVTIAAPMPGSAVDMAPNPFTDYFVADHAGSGLYIDPGTAGILGAEANHDRNTVLKYNGYQITFYTKDADDGSRVDGAPEIPAAAFGSGKDVNLPAPLQVQGYELDKVVIEQGEEEPKQLQAHNEPGGDFGKVTGRMPGRDVEVTYEYRKKGARIEFEANGGEPQPEPMTGPVGSRVNGMLPVVSRSGYKFFGWSETDSREAGRIHSLPEYYPETPLKYYAIFVPDPETKFNYTVEHSNKGGDIVFRSDTQEAEYSVEAAIEAEKKEVPGYTWSRSDSGTSPSEYAYNGRNSEPIGQFDGGTGNFAGTMPGQAATVRYRYKVDSGNPNARFEFKVNHETEGGTPISNPQTSSHYAEDAITIQPVTRYGYRCVDLKIVQGGTASRDALTSALKWDPLASDKVFHGTMPNQPVEITYVYEPTDEEYPLAVKYVDNDTLDESLKNIQEPLIYLHKAEKPVGLSSGQEEGVYRQPYGYELADKSMTPQTASIHFSNGGSGNDFDGIMPNDSVTVTYKHSRIGAKWANVSYRAGEHGSLIAEEGMSSDVQSLGDGSFRASILIDDGTEQGREAGYTLGRIKERHLAPGASAENYYRFAGWFVDTNGNGILDGDEVLLDEGSRFTGATVLTAFFEKDPAKWIDVHFEAGSHGSIDAGEALSLNTTIDKTWNDITGGLPHYTPEANYLADGWYAGEEPVSGGMNLAGGQTYTIRFRPDPAAFGTDVTQPEAQAGLNSSGKGRITVYNTTPGYRYLLADASGKILEVINGKELTSRVAFDGLYPGADYLVYEADGSVQARPGGLIGELVGEVSTAAAILTPVLETNYQISYDEEEEGTVVLAIKPADPDSEYAVLDSSGHVTGSVENGGFRKPSGSPASLTFKGLDYNREYTVVARPLGKTDADANSLIEKGSTITTDPGGELELANYILEAQNGEIIQVGEESVGSGRYEKAHKGDLVKVSADAVNGAGRPFSHWEATLGTAGELGEKTAKREASFTMPDTNVVLTAVYEREKASPSNATVVDEVRGASRKETALDPNEIPRLEGELTTAEDVKLLDVNHADVTYKVVYRRNAVKASESNAVKASGSYGMEHEAAYKGAWGLDVLIERYVNGRKVDGAADPEASLRTYIQMGKDDVDMMDYQLYEVTVDPETGEVQATLLTGEDNPDDPEETGGLFAFTAHAKSRYIMTYNRAYRVYFINDKALPIENRNRYYFKVRRDESPEDDAYNSEYGQVAEQLEYFVNADGVEFQYEGWSYSRDRYKEFDPSAPIRRRTHVYASYRDNAKETDDARKELDDEIKEAIKLSEDKFLKLYESEDLKEAVREALEMFERENPKATVSELREALEKLKEKTKEYKGILDIRYDDYEDIQDNGNKGGSKGGGGSGSGTREKPFAEKQPESYTSGANGNWVEISAEEGSERQLAFVLNGGMKLNGMWAWIKEADDAGRDAPEQAGWYYFNDKGIMVTGWICDEGGSWRYCSKETEGSFGKMQTGWHQDGADGNWYYLMPEGGAMATGWRKIGEAWHYFETSGAGTYVYNPQKDGWDYGGGSGKPLGSMYKDEITPDGYKTGGDGAWIQ